MLDAIYVARCIHALDKEGTWDVKEEWDMDTKYPMQLLKELPKSKGVYYCYSIFICTSITRLVHRRAVAMASLGL